jgi:hypothetical protein
MHNQYKILLLCHVYITQHVSGTVVPMHLVGCFIQCCMEFIHFGDAELESCSHMSIDLEVIDFVSPCKCI